ncbi:MAG: helix-turn-helix transcriptional regulator [Chitinophagales bacterium]
MTDISNINWPALSDKAIAKQIGHFIKTQRLEQNKTQNQIAKAAGISRSTLSLLERGQTVTLASFIQVLRVLDKLHLFKIFETEEKISPLALAKMQKQKRQRARPSNKNKKPESDW